MSELVREILVAIVAFVGGIICDRFVERLKDPRPR